MKAIKSAALAAFAVATLCGPAGAMEHKAGVASAKVSTCYYRYSILTPDAEYDVYDCYSNGDGSY